MKIDTSNDIVPNSQFTDNTKRPADHISPDGYQEWYRWKGDPFRILHNVNGPAIIFSDGEKRYYRDGFEIKGVQSDK